MWDFMGHRGSNISWNEEETLVAGLRGMEEEEEKINVARLRES